MTPPTRAPGSIALRQVAVDSLAGSAGTMVSRASGLVRVVVVATVLGPTQFADLYQAANNLPNLAFELLAGGLLTSLLVPALVRHLDRGDTAAAERLASSFLSLVIIPILLVVVIAVAAGPLLLGLLTAGVPAGAPRTGTGPAWLLLGLLLLQVPLYLCAGMAAALQNARGRFALAAGAPSVENLAIIVVLVLYGLFFGSSRSDGQGLAAVALLAGGTTGAVLLHAVVQLWGARRSGARLVLTRNLRADPEVRALLRLGMPSLGFTSLESVRYFCVLVVAAAVPGGVVAFTIAWAFYRVPVAVGAQPVAQAGLRALARAYHRNDDADYSETFSRTFGLALFMAVPAAVAFAVLSGPLVRAIAYGEMATPHGRDLLQYCLLGISLGIIGEAVVVYGTQAAYARRRADQPMRAVALRTVLALVGMLGSMALLDGPVLLLGIGTSIAVSDLVAAVVLCWMICRPLPRPTSSLLRRVTRTLLASLAMVPVVVLFQAVVGPPASQTGAALLTLLLGATGAAVYVGAQWLLRSPEVAALRSLVGARRRTAQAQDG